VAVPVSLAGTFAVMYLCGYSLNNLSLMALTVATGFVVDDAIVVLENISRHIEAGMAPMRAALLGAREVGFTVVSMSLSLIAVFVPILAMGGIVGRLFREFAVTLSAAILVSLLVSLTLTPMMCARLPQRQPESARPAGRLSRWAKAAVDWLDRMYGRTLNIALDHSVITLLVLACTVGLNVYLYNIVPKGFFPQQDTGMMIGGIQADQSISFQAMRPKLASFVEIVRADPAVQNVTAFTGGAQRNSGFMYIVLKPLEERGATSMEVIARLRPKLGRVPGASLFLQPVQDIRIGGRAGNALYQFTLQGDDLEELRKWEPRVRAGLSSLPELADVNTDLQDKGLQTSINFNRDAMSRLGLSPAAADAVLNDAFGQRMRTALAVSRVSRNTLAVACGVSPQAVQKWCDGVAYPSSGRMIKICEVTGCSAEWLMWPHLLDIRSTEWALNGTHIKNIVATAINELAAQAQPTNLSGRVRHDL
jgi:multidrug efflux pump